MKREKTKGKRNTGTRLLASALIFGMLSLTPIAAEARSAPTAPSEALTRAARSPSETIEAPSARKIDYNLPGIPSRSLSYYRQKSIYLGGSKLSLPAATVNGITYVPIKDIAERIAGARVSVDHGTRSARISARGLTLSATHGGYVTYANDRPFFSFSPTVYMTNGEIYVPLSVITRSFGIFANDTSYSLTLSGSYSPPKSASAFYREDEVYWLSKIISAESSGESLLGQIAVGDVILNRVKSKSFPNTIYSVIFDRKYGVQFSPTADGRIYAAPTYTATLAAKICLEGISLSDNAMYFLNPRIAASNWIVKNRPYVYTIGNHDFYE